MDAHPQNAQDEAHRWRGDAVIRLNGVALVAIPSGALYWPERGALIVADLHLEKGSSFARRGVLLPPYDTSATLARLAAAVTHFAPRLVIALGDSFHDRAGAQRLSPADLASLAALQRGREWMWIAGNHDPHAPRGIGGDFAAMLALDGLTFRHEPAPHAAGEMAGHLHPVARLAVRGQALTRRCFASDAQRIVLPAFGAYAGGLDVRHRRFAELFAGGFTAHLLGERRLFALAVSRA